MPWTFRRRGVWAIAPLASRAGKGGEGKKSYRDGLSIKNMRDLMRE